LVTMTQVDPKKTSWLQGQIRRQETSCGLFETRFLFTLKN